MVFKANQGKTANLFYWQIYRHQKVNHAFIYEKKSMIWLSTDPHLLTTILLHMGENIRALGHETEALEEKRDEEN